MKSIFTAIAVLCTAIFFISCDGSGVNGVEAKYKKFTDEFYSYRLEIEELKNEELEIELEYYEYVASLDDEEFEEWAENHEAWAEEVYEEFEERFEEIEDQKKENSKLAKELKGKNPGLI